MRVFPLPRVALATCAALPDLDPDSRHLADRLETCGVEAIPAVWDDPQADWNAVGLTVVRCCWDYVERREAFLAWAAGVPHLANPVDVLMWNTDKTYLRQLRAAGVATVETEWVAPAHPWAGPPSTGDWVVKPAVSLAGLSTGRYRMDDSGQAFLARRHVQRLQRAGRTVMVQPYLSSVDRRGEVSMVFIAGVFSHAVLRPAQLAGPDHGEDHRYDPAAWAPVEPTLATAAQLSLAQRALAETPGGPRRLLYARVDVAAGDDGAPVLMELELTEPQLHLASAEGAADRLAAAIKDRVASPGRTKEETS